MSHQCKLVKLISFLFAAQALAIAGTGWQVHSAQAQEEVYHPGETYDSLQAGHDAYLDAEAERRAQIARQIMIQEQIIATNTWANPADRYRPVHAESYGPIRPRFYRGTTLSDVYGGGTFYGGSGYSGSSWPQVPGDIYGTPYYGFVRQPIGHIKIWTGPQSYIYKPIYASPPMAEPVSAQPRPDLVRPQKNQILTEPSTGPQAL